MSQASGSIPHTINNGGTSQMLVDDYVTYLRAAGRRPNTIEARRRLATILCRTVDPLTCPTGDLVQFLAHPAWKPATRAANRAGVRSFFRWMKAAGHRDDDPSADLPAVRVPPAVPHPASEAALAHARAEVVSPHERAMLELATRCGLRRAEVAGLRYADLQRDPDGWILRVTGKGGRVRVVPCPDDMAAMLLDLRTDWVFPGRYPGEHVSPNWVGQRLSALLGPGVTAHDLRHRYATRIYATTRDLLAVQQLLGHSSVATTQVYIRVPMNDLREAIEAAS